MRRLIGHNVKPFMLVLRIVICEIVVAVAQAEAPNSGADQVGGQ